MAFNMGMPGNTHVEKLIERKQVSDGEAVYLATMALAYETHTANLLSAVVAFPELATDDLKETIKGRMGL